MNAGTRVLLVAQNRQLAGTLAVWLAECGCDPEVAATFMEGKDRLCTGPAIVIAEMKLGAYNGLHLALHARARGIPAVVFGTANTMTRREAEALGAVYVNHRELQKGELQSVVRSAAMPLRDSPAV